MRLSPFTLPLLFVALLSAVACGDDDGGASSAAQESDPPGHNEEDEATSAGGPRVAGIAWEVPEPFTAQTPSSDMRAAEYVFPEQQGETAATLAVFFFGSGEGGTVDANVARWVGQFEGGEPETTEREVNDLPVTLVDVTGTYQGMRPTGNTGPAQSDQRMLAAIVEGPDGPVFFKMVGDRSLMERAEPAFMRLVDTIHPE